MIEMIKKIPLQVFRHIVESLYAVTKLQPTVRIVKTFESYIWTRARSLISTSNELSRVFSGNHQTINEHNEQQMKKNYEENNEKLHRKFSWNWSKIPDDQRWSRKLNYFGASKNFGHSEI